MMPEYIYPASHTGSDTQSREPRESRYCPSTRIQHPGLLLIVIPACRRIINCIARYRVAQLSLRYLDEADSSRLSTDLPEAVGKLISQLYWHYITVNFPRRLNKLN